MAAKKTSYRWTWRDFALQFSVVVAGIVVTFVGSDLISRWARQREVRATMQLVYEELKANRGDLEAVCKSLYHNRRGMAMLQEYRMDFMRIPVDSLAKYQYILGTLSDFRPDTDALDVLRSSGVITAVGDKSLLLEIFGCYSWMTDFSKNVNVYNDQKMKSLNHLFANGMTGTIGGADPVESWRTMMDDPMCAAFFGTMGNFFDLEFLRGAALEDIDRVTKALNDKYRFE